jgi:hypothetical protein
MVELEGQTNLNMELRQDLTEKKKLFDGLN